MNKILASLLAVSLAAVTLLFIGSARSDVASAEASPAAVTLPIGCSLVDVTGSVAHITCIQDGVAIPPGLVDVPLPPIPPVTKTIKIPGPTKTVKIPLPRATVTRKVPIPGPTKTVTVEGPQRIIRGPERTVTRRPLVVQTVTVPGPTKTVTRQARPGRDTLPPRENPEKVYVPVIDTVIKKVGLGLLALAGIMGLIILGLWLGYALGYRDKDKSEKDFLEALRAQMLGRGSHE